MYWGGIAQAAHRGSHQQKRERVIHLVANTGVEDGEHVRRQASPEAVRGEGAERDPQESRNRSDQEECAVHSLSIIRRPRRARCYRPKRPSNTNWLPFR